MGNYCTCDTYDPCSGFYFFLYPALKDEVKDDKMVSSSTSSAVQEQNPVSVTPTITGPDTIEIHASYLKNPCRYNF